MAVAVALGATRKRQLCVLVTFGVQNAFLHFLSVIKLGHICLNGTFPYPTRFDFGTCIIEPFLWQAFDYRDTGKSQCREIHWRHRPRRGHPPDVCVGKYNELTSPEGPIVDDIIRSKHRMGKIVDINAHKEACVSAIEVAYWWLRYKESRSLRYHRVELHSNLWFSPHLEIITAGATKAAYEIGRLMLNIGGREVSAWIGVF